MKVVSQHTRSERKGYKWIAGCSIPGASTNNYDKKNEAFFIAHNANVIVHKKLICQDNLFAQLYFEFSWKFHGVGRSGRWSVKTVQSVQLVCVLRDNLILRYIILS